MSSSRRAELSRSRFSGTTISGPSGVSAIARAGISTNSRASRRGSGERDVPILEGAIGYLECTLVKDRKLDAGTHSIFVGDVVGGALFKDEEPLTYARYHAAKDTA